MNVLQQLFRAAGLRGGDLPVPARAWPAAPESSGLPPRTGVAAQPRLSRQSLEDENRRLRDERDRHVRLFAAAVHDLRQPLQALMLFSEALSEGAQSREQQRRVAHLRQSVASLDRLCAGMLDLAPLDTAHEARPMGPVPLAPVLGELRHTFAGVARAQGLRLVVRPCARSVQGDAVMLTRILNNLVSNALRHTVRGGVLVGVRRDGAGLRIEVRDSGCGMAHAQQAQILEAIDGLDPDGACRPGQGIGLGLGTVLRLARLQGARISVRSRPGSGSTVALHCQPASADR
ncbi:HAMP domain-containing sensor histidine kinase [Xenophilus sp. Marseille-Q4582]|uniref:sensor histidine kinase n=1 Tax=Xenophilus sp. Marseille-Q4582 TaxID=2866600 RepID=UPI001CE4535C|nr:HAMP domain-containing sensor histidine kinase [Xenophilus sp. Marseille-Q4582]